MKPKSAWGRGLLYGGIFGGAIAVFPVCAALFGSVPLGEVALAGSMMALIWGSVGFLAGFCSHYEQPADSAGILDSGVQVSFIIRLLYRFVAGFLLSYIAGGVVIGIGLGMVVLADSDLIGPDIRRATPEVATLIKIACIGLIGAEAGAIFGCWTGALLVRGGNQLAPIARGAFVSALLGILTGGWFGGFVGLIDVQLSVSEEIVITSAAITGALAGILSALLMRASIFR